MILSSFFSFLHSYWYCCCSCDEAFLHMPDCEIAIIVALGVAYQVAVLWTYIQFSSSTQVSNCSNSLKVTVNLHVGIWVRGMYMKENVCSFFIEKVAFFPFSISSVTYAHMLLPEVAFPDVGTCTHSSCASHWFAPIFVLWYGWKWHVVLALSQIA